MSVTVPRPTQYWPAITLRIALKRSSVAASLRTTPRAPNSSASTTCASSIATVSSEHLRAGSGRGQRPQGVEARGPWHGEVQQQDVGLHLASQAHGVEAVGRLAHHLEAPVVLEEAPQPLAEDGVIVGDHDSDDLGRWGHGASRGRRISSRAPSPGDVTSVSSPPRARTRSLMT